MRDNGAGELVRQRMAETEARKQGAEKLAEFLTKLLGVENLTNPEAVLAQMAKLDYVGFEKALTRINGIASAVPVDERMVYDAAAHGHRTTVDTVGFDFVGGGGLERKTELVFPPLQDRIQLIKQAFAEIQKLLQQGDPRMHQYIARTLYHAVSYTHLYKDGNGRTARLLYLLTSAHIEKDPATVGEHMQKVLAQPSPELLKFHQDVNRRIYGEMLKSRKLPATHRRDALGRVEYDCRMQTPEDFGFDGEYLAFIAALNVLEAGERTAHAIPEGKKGDFSFSWWDFKDAQRDRIKSAMDHTRLQFLKKLLDVSLGHTDDEELDRDMDPPDKAFV